MTEVLSSLPFEKGGNEGGSAFFITVSWQFPDLSKSNRILSPLQLFAQQEILEWLWCGDYATFNVGFISVTAA